MASLQRRFAHSRFAADAAAVSEVTGYLLVLAVGTMLVAATLPLLQNVQDVSVERAAQAESLGMAKQVASLVVAAALFSDRHDGPPDEPATLQLRLALPEYVAGRVYTLQLTTTSVAVEVPDIAVTEAAGLFAASGPPGVTICDSSLAGGPAYVRYDDRPAGCAGSTDHAVFLEAAS